MRSSVLLAIAALTASATAQLANTFPAAATGVPGNSSNAFPWGTPATAWPGLRIMALYDSTHLTGGPQPFNGPTTITKVRWRANESFTSWAGGTFSQATLSLATAAVDQAAATTTWANNVGPDYTTVYSGPVTVIPGSGLGTTVPGPICVEITLTTPFVYDPSLGDLVVDTEFLTGAWGGGTQATLDVQTTNGLARRVYASSMYPNANGVDTGAPVIEIVHTPVGPGTVAFNTTLGAGCINVPDTSSYELFGTAAAFDLSNTSITLLRSSTGYLAIPGTSAFVPPSASATTLSLADNAQVSVNLSGAMPVGANGSTTSLMVCSNGFISSATGNGTGAAPVVNTFLNSPAAFWSLAWHNFNPAIAGSGQVKFEQIGSTAYITWDGVWDATGTSAANASTMQAQFDVTTGNVNYVYGTMSLIGNSGYLVGFSNAGVSADPGSMDISAALPATYTAAVFAIAPVTVAATSRPLLGTSWNLQVTNIPAAGTIGIDIFGLSDPGLNDLAFLGMPSCGLRASLDLMNAFVVAGSSHTHGLAIPNNPVFNGVHLYSTTAVFVPGVNAFGAITGNGVDANMGDL